MYLDRGTERLLTARIDTTTKCNMITLPPEPTADKLREWISEVKEGQERFEF